MTAETMTSTPEGRLVAGDWISFREAMTAWGEVRPRGASVQLTPDLIARTINRKGSSWLDRIDTEGARIQRGQWPATEPRWRYGDPEWAEEREAARRRAWSLLDPVERAAAREAVEREYGPAPTSSRTLSEPTSSPQQRAAQEQRRRLDAGGLRATSNYAPQRREV